jgi:hypothetical protein
MEPGTRRRLLAAAGAAGVTAAGIAIGTRDGGGGGNGEPRRALPEARGATSRTTDRFGLGDVGIANYLLTVQRVEADVYRQAVRSGVLSGPARSLFAGFAREEASHAARLEATVRELGGRPVRRRRGALPSAGQDAFVQAVTSLEDMAAGALLGQLPAIDTGRLLRVVLAIHTVDARHAATLGLLSGLDPAPDGAFAQPVDAGTVLAGIRPLLRG